MWQRGRKDTIEFCGHIPVLNQAGMFPCGLQVFTQQDGHTWTQLGNKSCTWYCVGAIFIECRSQVSASKNVGSTCVPFQQIGFLESIVVC